MVVSVAVGGQSKRGRIPLINHVQVHEGKPSGSPDAPITSKGSRAIPLLGQGRSAYMMIDVFKNFMDSVTDMLLQ